MGCAFLAGVAALMLLLSIWAALQFEPVQRKYIYPFPYRTTVEQYADTYGVDVHLAAAVIKVESKFRDDVHSHRGAVGLMQLMPETAAGLGVNPYDAAQNIDGGTKYLKSLLDTFGGDVRKAVAAYNAGPEAVKRYGGVPPYQETKQYVDRVLDLYR